MTDQPQAEPKKDEPKLLTITGKDLAQIKRQLLGNVSAKYQEFCNFLAQMPGDDDLKMEGFEFLDKGILRLQEAILSIKSLVTQTVAVPVSPPQASNETNEAKAVEGIPEVNQEAPQEVAQEALNSDAA